MPCSCAWVMVWRAAASPDAAIAVNPPIDLARCAELICAPEHRVFNLYFVRACVRYARQRDTDGIHPRPPARVHLRMSLKEFDDAFTAPLGGFRDRHDYYRKASALPHLSNITRPTVILHAEDDPFIDPVDFQRARLGPGVHLHLERHGGHLGYVSRDLPTRRWLTMAWVTISISCWPGYRPGSLRPCGARVSWRWRSC